MTNVTFETRRGELKTYFGRTAADKWVALTSQTPVSRIRETVRAGRERTRTALLSFLPADMNGTRMLDAGCGTGVLAMEAAQRGGTVLGVDISSALVAEANARAGSVALGRLSFEADDMSADRGEFDHVVAMDSVIHYPLPAMVDLLNGFAQRATTSIAFTFAPSTPALEIMKFAGKFFPKNDRSPAIEPVKETALRAAIAAHDGALGEFEWVSTERVTTAFYKSTCVKLVRRSAG